MNVISRKPGVAIARYPGAAGESCYGCVMHFPDEQRFEWIAAKNGAAEEFK